MVLGAQAASTLQIFSVRGHIQVFLGGTWFTVIGIMQPVTLDSTLDSTVFIGLPVAERLFQTQPNPSEIYVRADQSQVTPTSKLLAATANPQQPDGVSVGVPVDALKARAAAKGQFTTLLLGLVRWRCWWGRSGSPTSWSSPCSSAGGRSGYDARWVPPSDISAPSFSPSPRCWRHWVASLGCCWERWQPWPTRWASTSR